MKIVNKDNPSILIPLAGSLPRAITDQDITTLTAARDMGKLFSEYPARYEYEPKSPEPRLVTLSVTSNN